jgi:hypothetical protein
MALVRRKNEYAPAALFAYRRPGHLRRAAESLAANPEAAHTDVYVFCDGAKSRRDAGDVQAVRVIARALGGFHSVTVIERNRNLGLAASLIAGVTQVVDAHDRVIVVEDDLVLSPYFLSFMDQALERYADDERVASVHGYIFPVRHPLPETFFLKGAECWGWATWRRAWRRFNPDAADLLRSIRERRLEHEFDLDGAYPYTAHLGYQARGKLDSWAIRWRASCYLANMLTLYPGRALVRNAGFDASGVHCDESAEFEVTLADSPVVVKPIAVEPSGAARAAYVDFFRRLERPGLMRRAWRFAARFARRGHALA